MSSNVYVRDKNSIMRISLMRITMLLPLILYGIYKNGIFLFSKGYVGIVGLFKPLVLILGSVFVATIVNYTFETIKFKKKKSFFDKIFSSFNIEYALLLALCVPVGINVFIYFIVLFIGLLLLNLLPNRINSVALMFIMIYFISYWFTGFSFASSYDLNKEFSYTLFDYLIGRGVGGIGASNVLFMIIWLIGTHITNNNKTLISVITSLTVMVLYFILSFITNSSFLDILFNNNVLLFTLIIATDGVTSCYSIGGMRIYSVLIGVLSFVFYFINPIICIPIAILISSLFNNLIDRISLKIVNSRV